MWAVLFSVLLEKTVVEVSRLLRSVQAEVFANVPFATSSPPASWRTNSSSSTTAQGATVSVDATVPRRRRRTVRGAVSVTAVGSVARAIFAPKTVPSVPKDSTVSSPSNSSPARPLARLTCRPFHR